MSEIGDFFSDVGETFVDTLEEGGKGLITYGPTIVRAGVAGDATGAAGPDLLGGDVAGDTISGGEGDDFLSDTGGADGSGNLLSKFSTAFPGLSGLVKGVSGEGGSALSFQAVIAAVAELVKFFNLVNDTWTATNRILAGDLGGGLRLLQQHQAEFNEFASTDQFFNAVAQTEKLAGLLSQVTDRLAPDGEFTKLLHEISVTRQNPLKITASRAAVAKQTVHRQAVRAAIRRDMVAPDYAAFRRSSFEEVLHSLPKDQQAETEAARRDPTPGEIDPNLDGASVERSASEPPAGEFQAHVTGHGFNKLHGVSEAIFQAIAGGVAGNLGEILKTVEDQPDKLLKVAAAGLPLLLEAGELLVKPSLSVIEAVVEATFGRLGEVMIQESVEALAGLGEVAPGGQHAAAAKLLTQAFLRGHEAHAISAACELVFPLKHLGLPQLSALLVDLAGFKEIAQAELGSHIGAAIKKPAGYEAARRYRSTLPDPATAEGLVLERKLAVEDYADILRWHGYPEDHVKTMVEAVWIEPRTREVMSLLDDTDLDRFWLERKFTEAGLEEADILKWMEAANRRQTRTVRQQYFSALLTRHRNGSLSTDQLNEELIVEKVGNETARLILNRAAVERNGELIELAVKAADKRGREGLTSSAEYEAELIAYGLDPEYARWKRIILEADQGGDVLAKERNDLEKLVNEDRQTRVRLIRESFDRGLLDADQLTASFIAAGVTPPLAEALASLAQVEREPVPRKPVLLSEEAQLQRIDALIQEAALTAYRRGEIDTPQLSAVLLGTPIDPLGHLNELLGIQADNSTGITGQGMEVAAIVARESARRRPVPRAFLVPDQTEQQARQLQTEAALTEFRTGKITVDSLRAKLTALGHPASIVDGFVARELAREKPPPPEPEPPPPKVTAEQRRVRQLQEQIARELFRAGELSREDASIFLIEAGLDPLVVQAMFDLEELRFELAVAKEAAAAAEG